MGARRLSVMDLEEFGFTIRRLRGGIVGFWRVGGEKKGKLL